MNAPEEHRVSEAEDLAEAEDRAGDVLGLRARLVGLEHVSTGLAEQNDGHREEPGEERGGDAAEAREGDGQGGRW